MPEDLLSGVLGGENEQPEAEAPQAVAGAEAFAAAIAAIASRQDPGVARKTEVFLEEQTLLLKTQRHHLEEEHASRLRQLRLAVGAAKRRRFADFLRNCLYACVALLALGVLFAGVRMTYEALSDHGLVVEDFTVPSDFAARGVTSQALAEDLASRVAAIRTTVNRSSLSHTSEVRANQAGTLSVQIPETGVSIDELERFLHGWLGHQTKVNGELRDEVGGSIFLVLHIAGADPIEVSGSSANLDGLVQTAAEKAFAIFDPLNYSAYLTFTGRAAEGYDAALRNVQDAGPEAQSTRDRAVAYSLLAFSDPDQRRALSRALIATDLDPRLLVSWQEAGRASANLGHDAATVQFARKLIATQRRDQPASEWDTYPDLIAEGHIVIDQAMGDFAALAEEYEGIYRRRPSAPLGNRYAVRALTAARLHDQAAARQALTFALAIGPADGDTALEAQWYVSTAAGDWEQALNAARAWLARGEAQKAAAPSPEFAARPELALATESRPRLAYAEAMTGDTASATALIAQSPADCYLCARTHAKIAAVAGDAGTADRWFAEAVRQAPDLPMAYYEWGETLLTRGNLAGAARELALAHAKGPHFADALKTWGDVLAKQGHWSDALAKYDEALKYAPNWAALKQARDTARKSS